MMLYPTAKFINENYMKGTYNMYCEVQRNGRKAAMIYFMVTYNCKLNDITIT
jgi:hypothetical protein